MPARLLPRSHLQQQPAEARRAAGGRQPPKRTGWRRWRPVARIGGLFGRDPGAGDVGQEGDARRRQRCARPRAGMGRGWFHHPRVEEHWEVCRRRGLGLPALPEDSRRLPPDLPAAYQRVTNASDRCRPGGGSTSASGSGTASRSAGGRDCINLPRRDQRQGVRQRHEHFGVARRTRRCCGQQASRPSIRNRRPLAQIRLGGGVWLASVRHRRAPRRQAQQTFLAGVTARRGASSNRQPVALCSVTPTSAPDWKATQRAMRRRCYAGIPSGRARDRASNSAAPAIASTLRRNNGAIDYRNLAAPACSVNRVMASAQDSAQSACQTVIRSRPAARRKTTPRRQ